MHYGLCAEESLISGRTAEKDNLGSYEHKLLSQKGLAAVDLLGCGAPVLGRPAFRDIADMVIVIGKAVASKKVLKGSKSSSKREKTLEP